MNTVNLLALAQAANASLPGRRQAASDHPDPIVLQTLNQIWGFAGTGNLKTLIASSNDYNRETYSEQPSSLDARTFWTGRMDYNLTEKHHLSYTMNYDVYTSAPDLLNGVYPVSPEPGPCSAAPSMPDSEAAGSPAHCFTLIAYFAADQRDPHRGLGWHGSVRRWRGYSRALFRMERI